MPRSRTLTSLALFASLSTLAFAGAASTQVPPPPGAQRAGPPAEARAQMQQRMAARRAERDRDLATVLRLRPEQMGALQAFVASQTPQRPGDPQGPGVRQGRDAPQANLTTPQRLDQQAARGAARQAQRQAMMERRAQGLRSFYAALNPEQQQVFDALTRLRASDGGGGRGGHGMRGGRNMRFHAEGRGGPGGARFGPRGFDGPPPPPPVR